MRPIFVMPSGSILPDNIGLQLVDDGPFLSKLWQASELDMPAMRLTSEELVALVEKPHLFGLDLISIAAIPGGRYDVVWSTYTAALRRVTLDTLAGELEQIKKQLADRPLETEPQASKSIEADNFYMDE